MTVSKPKANKTGKNTESLGVISKHEIYRLDEFLSRVGWSDAAWRTARRNGLQVIRTANRGYVDGSEFDRYLKTLVETKENAE